MRHASAGDMVGGCDILSSSSGLYPHLLSSSSSKPSRGGWRDNERGRLSGVVGGDFKLLPPMFSHLVSCDSPVNSPGREIADNLG